MTSLAGEFSKVKYGDGLTVTPEGADVIRVDAGGIGTPLEWEDVGTDTPATAGIRFDTDPQTGGFLHIGVGSARVPGFDASMVIESNSLLGLELWKHELEIRANRAGLLVYSRGRMQMMSEAAVPPAGSPRLQASVDLHSDLPAGSGAGMSANSLSFVADGIDPAYPTMDFHSTDGRGYQFRLYKSGQFAISLHQLGATPAGATKFAIYADTDNSASPVGPLFEVRRDGSVHIKSGTTIQADL